jgi:hypothetical protein
MLLAVFLVAMSLFIIITGVLSYRNDAKNNNRHSIFIDREANADGACYSLCTSRLRRMGLILWSLLTTAFTGTFNDDAPFDFFTSLLLTLSDFDPDNGVSDVLCVSGMD